MATNLSQPATLENLQRVVENMKVYVDSDKTKSIKGYKKINNTHNFYNTTTPSEDSIPIFSFDIVEEMFLDQTKTIFVPNFVWSAETYVDSIDPSLDGKPVMVLAVKGEESITYSFLNLEELVDTYTTKDTATLSLVISDDGEISGDVKVSEKEGNIITAEEDGLYATGGGEEPLIVEMRFDVGTPICTITSLSETYQTIYEALRTDREVVVKGYNNNARTDAPLWFYPIGYIANSNMATFQCIYNYSNTSITAYYLQISSVSNNLTYNQYDMTKPEVPEIPYGEEGQFVSFDEEGNLIAVDAPSGGSEPFLVTFYFNSTSMSLVKNVDKTYDEISAALDENKAVILKGIDTSQNSQQFYYFNVSKYDKSASQIIFTRVYHTYGAKPEIWYYLLGAGHMIGKFTIDLSNYALTEDLDNYVQKEEGKGLSTNDLTDDLLEILESDHRYAGITGTTETNLNSIQTPGLYNIDLTAKAYSNAPSGISRFTLEVTAHTRYIVQKAFGIYASTTSSASNSTPTFYVRAYDTLLYSWTSWSKPNASYAANAGTVNNHTVEADVPSDAKFTDTVPTLEDLGITVSASDLNSITGKAPTNHASNTNTYGVGSSSNYGHLKISDSYTSTPNSTSYGASAGIAASLYTVQMVNQKADDALNRVNAIEDTLGYTLEGIVSFTATIASMTVATSISIVNSGGKLPFSESYTNTGGPTGYFYCSADKTYHYKYKNRSPYIMRIGSQSTPPTASSTLATSILNGSHMIASNGNLSSIDYGTISFKSGQYYFGYNADTTVGSTDRGGYLFLYTRHHYYF